MIKKVFQIHEIPDLSLSKYQSLSDSGVSGVLARHTSFLRQWHGMCKDSKSSLHLLYYFNPDALAGNRLNIYFIIQGEDDVVETLIPLLNKSPLSDFYHFKPSKLPHVHFLEGATLIKKEREASLYNPNTFASKEFHYVPKWEVNNDARLYDLFSMMETVSLAYNEKKPCAYRIDLYPNSLSEETRDVFTPIISEIRGDNDVKIVKEGYRHHDDYSNNVRREYEDWLSKVDSTPVFRVNMYGFANNTFLAKAILNAAASEAVETGDFTIAPIRTDYTGVHTLESRFHILASDYCSSKITHKLASWATTYTLEEVEPFFRLPALYDGESIEIPKETKVKPSDEGIYIGQDEQNYPVYFPLEDLSRHAFFSGMPGSGKTNTMLHLTCELKKKNIPFLVLEPAKKEYREMLSKEEMKDVYLFSPHLQSHFPLRMNPLAFVKGVRLSEHINALLEVFKGSFVLEGPTYKFLSSSIQRSYEVKGWDIEDINDGEKEYPTLKDVYSILESEIEAYSYDEQYKGNVRAFLQVRLGSLMERDAGELFNTSVSTLSPEEWIKHSAIVELEVLDEQAKNFFVLLVCHYILEVLRANPRQNPEMKVRHALFIEEAHNIIASSTMQSSSDSVDPKISATQYIVKMLAEVRALREAIIIADQLPTALTSEVTKNTGLKLVHRLTSQDDRELIGTAISASPFQNEQMALFTKGKALIHYEKTQKPYVVQVAYWPKPEIDYDYSIDSQLYARISEREAVCDSVNNALFSFYETYMSEVVDEYNQLLSSYKNCSFEDKIEVMKLSNDIAFFKNKLRKVRNKLSKYNDLYLLYQCQNEDINETYNDIIIMIMQLETQIKSFVLE